MHMHTNGIKNSHGSVEWGRNFKNIIRKMKGNKIMLNIIKIIN